MDPSKPLDELLEREDLAAIVSASEVAGEVTVTSEGLSARDGQLEATEDDPKISLAFDRPISEFGLRLACDPAYVGDDFSIYYMRSWSEPLSETQRVFLDVAHGCEFHGYLPCACRAIRIDPRSAVGSTAIRSLTFVGVPGGAELPTAFFEGTPQILNVERRVLDERVPLEESLPGSELKARLRHRHPVGDGSRVPGVLLRVPSGPGQASDDALAEPAIENALREVFGHPLPVAEGDSWSCAVVIDPFLVSEFMEASLDPLPLRLGTGQTLCAMAVGSAAPFTANPRNRRLSRYSKLALRLLFDGPFIHGVRDRVTAELLAQAGIANTVVVGVPSLWALDPDSLAAIPAAKGRRCVFVPGDDDMDLANDAVALARLVDGYDEVLLWPGASAGSMGYARRLLGELPEPGRVMVAPYGAQALTDQLDMEGTDYVGSSLEGAIMALARSRRTLVLAADDRVRGVAELTSMPMMRKFEVADALAEWVAADHEVAMTLPTEAVAIWKAQFRHK